MGGNAIERHQLVGANSQDLAQRGLDIAPAVPNERDDPRIEVSLSAQHPGGEFVREATIGVGQRSNRAGQCAIEWLALPHGEQHLECGAACREAG